MLRTDKSYFVLLAGLLGAIGILDTAILNPTVAAYAKALGADEVLASLTAGMYSIVAIPASLAMGLMIDVIGRKRALVMGLGLTALWIYGYSIATTPFHLLGFRVAHAISGSLVFPATIAMVVDTTKVRVGRGIGTYWTVVGVALAIGSFIPAAMVPTLGFRPVFLLVVGISLVGMIVAVALPETAKERFRPRASLGIVASSMRWLSVAYLSYFSLYFAFGVIVGSLSIALVLLGFSEEVASAAVGIYIGLAITISLPLFYGVGRMLHRVGTVKVLGLGLGLTALSQLVLMISLLPPYAYVSAGLLGVAIAFVFVASTSLAAMPKARGASVGLHQTANITGVAVGAPVSGLLLKYLGLLAPFVAAMAVQAIVLTIVVFSSQVMRSADEKGLRPQQETRRTAAEE